MIPPELHRRFFQPKVVPVLQNQSADCGLACLVMVCNALGVRIDLAAARERVKLSVRGVSLAGMIGAAERLGLGTRPLQVDVSAMHQLRLPCVLHWNNNHYVVLSRVSRGGLEIVDPSHGIRHVRWADLRSHFGGVVLEFWRSADIHFQNQSPISIVGLYRRVPGAARSAILILGLGLVLEALALLPPLYIQLLMDRGIAGGDKELISLLVIAFSVILLVQVLSSSLRSWVVWTIGTQLNIQLSSSAFRHLISLPLTYFETRQMGDIVSRFGSLAVVQRAMTTMFAELAIDGLLAVSVFVVLLFYSAQLTAIVLLSFVIYTFARVTISLKQRGAMEEYAINIGREQSALFETIRGAQTIKLLGGEQIRHQLWLRRMVTSLNSLTETQRGTILSQSIRSLTTGAETIFVAGIGAYFVLAGSFSIGMLVGFLAYKATFSGRFGSFIDKSSDLWLLKVQLRRFGEIASERPELSPATPQSSAKEATPPEIKFQGVEFRYGDEDTTVVEDLNVCFPAARSTAVVGASGCGKTTLLKLIAGLLQPTRGEIFVGDRRIGRETVAGLRSRIGVVFQEDILFIGTIGENISFFDERTDVDRIVEAAVMAGIHEEVAAMTLGYDTRVGDLGLAVSSGQKQRLLLARALYRGPALLLLDESTSNLDVDTERLVTSNLAGLDITRIVVAHRPDTIACAEFVFDMTTKTLFSQEDYRRSRFSVSHDDGKTEGPLVAIRRL